ncbi:DUF3592 domain-containing protein [Haliscomenobacter hydrossis]|uniref:DUF3592 domain-containing protein n=1 Tax=Haliscomenobacter hydrossis (strain ATCC 27775 / DSM 1100 / LMG 10767 / O) TaxID=760192 RepID=F4L6D2_HALH1|nr:DUF3592 domain-containing protein [Haliscomenobacter hydrossis]AEE48814.1 hypothetical protein Halhy_0913 [Haliscomenobacter hydrossis DSM 1100]
MEILNSISPYFSFLAFIGTYLLILANDRSHLVGRVKKRGIQTEGTVVELHQNPGPLFSKTSGEGVAPVVDFTTNGGTHRHYSTHYETPSPYQVGQKVQVWYYFYKSKREVTLADEDGGTLPQTFYRWGIVFCALGYPFLLWRLMLLVG